MDLIKRFISLCPMNRALIIVDRSLFCSGSAVVVLSLVICEFTQSSPRVCLREKFVLTSAQSHYICVGTQPGFGRTWLLYSLSVQVGRLSAAESVDRLAAHGPCCGKGTYPWRPA